MEITDSTELIIEELRLWYKNGNSLIHLYSITKEAGKLSLEIPKYNNTGSFKVKKFNNYSGALSFFGSLVDSATAN